MTGLRGWAPKGERLVDKVPQGRWKTATFLAALRQDRIDAPYLFDGPINGEAFAPMSSSFLSPPSSQATSSSSITKAVRRAIRDVGARLVFLPKYP
jgi:putative transposase